MNLIKTLDESIVNQSPVEFRNYIGASSIGHPCDRSLWLSYQGVQGLPFTAKQRRTFETGHRLEGMVVDYIEQAGFRVQRPGDNEAGIPCHDSEVSCFRGNMDGVIYISGIPFVLEIKTAKASEYKKFVDKGVMAWKPNYYAQSQSYMGMSGIGQAVIIVLNKDTSDWHSEYVYYDDIFYGELRAKAASISAREDMPDKIKADPSYYVCQMCKYKDFCHKPK